jgi:hypothetical protein
MKVSDVAEQIRVQRSGEHCCIKSWVDDHRIVDFNSIEQFLEQAKADDMVEGFELLTLEQMWEALIALDPDNLVRVATPAGETIRWLWTDKNGKEIEQTFPFSPEGIMTIMNDEFFS